MKEKPTPMQAALARAAKLEKQVDKLREQNVRLEERLRAKEEHSAYLEKRLAEPYAAAPARTESEADIASLLGVPGESDAA